MYIESIRYEVILDKYKIIALSVRGKEKILEQFCSDIQDTFTMAHDEWYKPLSMLTMTFDVIPKEQTLTMIRKFTRDYIKDIEDTI